MEKIENQTTGASKFMAHIRTHKHTHALTNEQQKQRRSAKQIKALQERNPSEVK